MVDEADDLFALFHIPRQVAGPNNVIMRSLTLRGVATGGIRPAPPSREPGEPETMDLRDAGGAGLRRTDVDGIALDLAVLLVGGEMRPAAVGGTSEAHGLADAVGIDPGRNEGGFGGGVGVGMAPFNFEVGVERN